MTAIVLSVPTVAESRIPRGVEDSVLVMVFETGVLTASWDSFDLPQSILSAPARGALAGASFPARTSYGILDSCAIGVR